MVVVVHEAADVGFKIARHVVVFKHNVVPKGLMSALDLARGLRKLGWAAHEIHAIAVKPFSEFCRDVNRPGVAHEACL